MFSRLSGVGCVYSLLCSRLVESYLCIRLCVVGCVQSLCVVVRSGGEEMRRRGGRKDG